jgi:hypothetical protein
MTATFDESKHRRSSGGQFATKSHASADDSVTFLEDAEEFAPPRPDPEPGAENPFVLDYTYTSSQWTKRMDEADAMRAELEQVRSDWADVPLKEDEKRRQLLRRERDLEERLSRQRLLCQEAMVRHAASSPDAERQVLSGLEEERNAHPDDRTDPHGDYGLDVSEVAVANSAQGMRRGYAKFREQGIGRDCEKIPAAEARRRLPVGAKVTRYVAIGPHTGYTTTGLTVEKQSAYQMELSHTGESGRTARSVLGWGGNRAYADADGRIVVCDQTDVPQVIYEREDG